VNKADDSELPVLVGPQEVHPLVAAKAAEAELMMFERAAKEISGITVRAKARDILEALGASFTPDGNEFFFNFPGSECRKARLIGPKGDTKMTRDQRARRESNKRSRKARKAGRK
jgi:hypothetical protein